MLQDLWDYGVRSIAPAHFQLAGRIPPLISHAMEASPRLAAIRSGQSTA
jgi:hypothetical protein